MENILAWFKCKNILDKNNYGDKYASNKKNNTINISNIQRMPKHRVASAT